MSLSGDTLYRLALSPEVTVSREQQLAAARAAADHTPDNVDSIIWLGRRTAYLNRYRDAIAIYTDGLARFPDDARLYRHRGHRYITVRQLDLAIEDLEHAARLIEGQPDVVEPDGLPNARNIPTSTLQSNIWYHLGLAHYLLGAYDAAHSAYQRCLEVSTNNDMLVATAYWSYMTLLRIGDEAGARSILDRVSEDMDIIENGSYHRLLLLFKGVLSESDVLDVAGEQDAALANATVGYGVGFWHATQGHEDRARAVWRRVLDGPQWAAFGYIAAEAEMAKETRRAG